MTADNTFLASKMSQGFEQLSIMDSYTHRSSKLEHSFFILECSRNFCFSCSIALEVGETEPLELMAALSLRLWYTLSNTTSMKSEAKLPTVMQGTWKLLKLGTGCLNGCYVMTIIGTFIHDVPDFFNRSLENILSITVS